MIGLVYIIGIIVMFIFIMFQTRNDKDPSARSGIAIWCLFWPVVVVFSGYFYIKDKLL